MTKPTTIKKKRKKKKALVSMCIREDGVECKAPYVKIKYKYTEPWKF